MTFDPETLNDLNKLKKHLASGSGKQGFDPKFQPRLELRNLCTEQAVEWTVRIERIERTALRCAWVVLSLPLPIDPSIKHDFWPKTLTSDQVSMLTHLVHAGIASAKSEYIRGKLPKLSIADVWGPITERSDEIVVLIGESFAAAALDAVRSLMRGDRRGVDDFAALALTRYLDALDLVSDFDFNEEDAVTQQRDEAPQLSERERRDESLCCRGASQPSPTPAPRSDGEHSWISRLQDQLRPAQ